MNSDLILESNLKVKNTKKPVNCRHCWRLIFLSEIQIRLSQKNSKKLRFHLHHYIPATPQYLIPSKLTIKLSQSTRPAFNSWLASWNSQFFPINSKEPKIFSSFKSLNFIQTKQKRLFLEIFKFLDLIDLVFSVSLVNKNFYELCWENELWQNLLIRDFQLFNQNNSKNSYLEEFSKRCFVCKLENNQDLLFSCPLLLKKFCFKCMNSDGRLEIIHQKNVFKAFLYNGDFIKVKSLKSDESGWITYKFIVKKAVDEIRKLNKQKVLDMLKLLGNDHELVKTVEKIDVLKIGNKMIENSKQAKSLGLKIKDKTFDYIIRKIYKFVVSGEGKIYAKKFEKIVKLCGKRRKVGYREPELF